MKRTILWLAVNTCRLLVAATFVLSGLVKLIDPHGTEYKIQDYLGVMHLEPLLAIDYLPLVLSVSISLLEFCLGVYLLIGIRRRTTLSLILLFLLIYTPMTLWLALTNAVTDCGCFGDALKLSNWQTFYKNVALLMMTAILLWQRRRLKRFFPESAQWIISIAAFCGGLALAAYCLYSEPIVDFRPFRIGQHIPTAMQWPEDPEQLPDIPDFNVEPFPFEVAAHTHIPDTDELLEDSSYVFLLTMPHIETADDANMERINELYDYAHLRGFRFLALTASGEEAISRWRDLTGAEYDFAFMDDLILKTIARSNPAMVVLHRGTVIGKWSHHRIPTPRQLSQWLAQQP